MSKTPKPLRFPKLGEVWRHIRTGREYVVLEFVTVEVEHVDAWVRGVKYAADANSKPFVRTERRFIQDFTKVSP